MCASKVADFTSTEERLQRVIFLTTVENEQQHFTQNIVASVGAKKLSLSLLPGVIIIALPAGVECQRKDTGRATQQPAGVHYLNSLSALPISRTAPVWKWFAARPVSPAEYLICSAEQFAWFISAMYTQILQIG